MFSISVIKLFLSWVIMCNVLSMEGLRGETADKIDGVKCFQ
jgi:hypothetical protein